MALLRYANKLEGGAGWGLRERCDASLCSAAVARRCCPEVEPGQLLAAPAAQLAWLGPTRLRVSGKVRHSVSVAWAQGGTSQTIDCKCPVPIGSSQRTCLCAVWKPEVGDSRAILGKKEMASERIMLRHVATCRNSLSNSAGRFCGEALGRPPPRQHRGEEAELYLP